jgi:hypothetical protein
MYRRMLKDSGKPERREKESRNSLKEALFSIITIVKLLTKNCNNRPITSIIPL